MKKLLEMYKKLNQQQKEKIFSSEEINTLDGLISFEKLFSDKKFYNAVEKTIGEIILEELRS